MQVARHPVQLPSPSNDPNIRIQGRSQGRTDGSPDNGGKNSESSRTTTTSQTSTSTSSRTTFSPTLTTTRSLPAPTSFVTIASPETITPGTITISATQATTQAITQIIFNPTTILSSSSLPSTATATASTNKPSFQFNSPDNSTVCGSLNLTWLYSGEWVIPMTLVVQDQVVPSVSGTANSAQPTSSVTFRTLTTSVPSDADSYLWTPVDVDEGWYTAKAFDTGGILGISAQSMPFFISQNQLHSPCPTANTTTSSRNPTDTSANSSGRPSLHVGDIVGIVLGSTAGVALLVLAFLFPRFWRKELPDPKTRRPYHLY